MGFTSEVDEEEALAQYYYLRLIVFVGLAIIVVLASMILVIRRSRFTLKEKETYLQTILDDAADGTDGEPIHGSSLAQFARQG